MSLIPPPAPTGFDLPEPLRSLAEWAFTLQRGLNGEMRQQLALMTDGVAWRPVLTILFAAFLYGIFHAIGPGHGKVVIGSWFATHRARVVHGLAACGLSAAVQGASAVAIVLLLAGVLSLAPRDVMAQAAWLEAGSYALITAMGAWMLVQAVRGRHACGHDHSDHSTCDHPHHHHHHHDDAGERRTLWAMAAAVGFRPCSGAILVLLFTLANGLLWVGIAATMAMALGVALTISGIGLSALGLNRLLESRFGDSAVGAWLRRALAVAGAGAILLLGLVLLLGVIQHGPALTG